jgi:hypothetical protein
MIVAASIVLNKERKIGVASLAMIGPCPQAEVIAIVPSVSVDSKHFLHLVYLQQFTFCQC